MRPYMAGRSYQEVRAAKIRILSTALRRHHWNKTHTARDLGLDRGYLIRLIKRLGVEGE